MSPVELIDKWAAAYEAANGKKPDRVPTYEKGWFVFKSPFFIVAFRARRKQLEEMIIALEKRAAA